RLRSADGVPIAIEISAIPSDILPDPGRVETSLYDLLRRSGMVPTRAVQRINAINVEAEDAAMLGLAPGTAVLQINRTGFLPSGRPIEFTQGIYRSDIYDFVAELKV